MPERDLFANFERMRREMDELFGDVFERTGLAAPAHRVLAGRRRRVRVRSAAGDRHRRARGVDLEDSRSQIEGRKLILAGTRRGRPRPEGDVYQQVEIERGPFRRTVELGADVAPSRPRARYEDGMLRVELPLAGGRQQPRAVPIEAGERR